MSYFVMDEALRQYYLQQMGIDTWHLRGNSSSIKLMVIGDPLLLQNMLMKAMLKSIGLLDEDVCIADASESVTMQIAKVMPQVIIAVGQMACLALFNKEQTAGTLDVYQGIPVVVSYHPVHLLEHRLDKKKAYADLLSVQQLFTQRV